MVRGRQLTMPDMLTGGPMLGEVAKEYGITIQELRGPNREQPLVEARVAAIKRLYGAGLSVAETGRLVNRDHSTILYHLNGGHRQTYQCPQCGHRGKLKDFQGGRGDG